MRVWTDDERNPLTYGAQFIKSTRALDVLLKYGREDWIWVKSVAETKRLLETEAVEIVSLDNDLGACCVNKCWLGISSAWVRNCFEDECVCECHIEGYEVLTWLEEKAFEGTMKIPETIIFHSANDARRDQAEAAIRNIKRFVAEKKCV